MNDLMVFEKEGFGGIRAIMRDGEPWFVANDVAAALGYARPKDAVAHHCKYVELLKGGESQPLTDSNFGVNIIPESDVYRLIMRSNLPAAEAFQDWVCEEIIPSIRKKGSYAVQGAQSLQRPLEDVATIYKYAGLKDNQLALALDKFYKAESGVSALEQGDVVLEAPVKQQLLTPTEIARELGTGYSARKVNGILAAMGLQRKRGNGKWEPVRSDLAVMQDTNKWHGGVPVTQLKWRSDIVRVIKDWLM